MSIYRGNALSIAGSDSGGGAGIQADLKTFAALKIFGMTAITAITAQNSLGVTDIHDIPPKTVETQLDAVFSDFKVDAVKTGMFSRSETVESVSSKLKFYKADKIVVDPVMIAQSGSSLISEGAVGALIRELIPLATIITPNVPEAEVLSGFKILNVDDMKKAAYKIAELGCPNVLLKGGHLISDDVHDVLLIGDEIKILSSQRIDTEDTHGTGCTLSSAIAAELAAGEILETAVMRGREYVRVGLMNSFRPGTSYGPLGHAVIMEWVG